MYTWDVARLDVVIKMHINYPTYYLQYNIPFNTIFFEPGAARDADGDVALDGHAVLLRVARGVQQLYDSIYIYIYIYIYI
jgi:hypothetical protein